LATTTPTSIPPQTASPAFPASSVNPRHGPSGVLTLGTTTPTSTGLQTRFRISPVPGRSVNRSLSPGLSGVKPSVTTTLILGPNVSPRPGGSGAPTSVTTTPTSTLLRTPFQDSLNSNANLPPNPRPGPGGENPSVTTTPPPGPSVSRRPGGSGAPTSATTTPTSIPLRTPSQDSPTTSANIPPNPRPGPSGAPTSETITPTNMDLRTHFQTSPVPG